MEENSLNFKRLILAGGAVKGLAYIGVLKCMEENRDSFCEINEFIGNSIGAFMCMLLILNYNSEELKEFFWDLDFNSYRKFSIKNFLTDYGLDSGEKVENLIKKMISRKGLDENISLSQLFNLSKKSLVVSGSNVNTREGRFFNKDTDPDMPVYLCVRISMNIPFIFSPVLYDSCYYVDGALTNNIPVRFSEGKGNFLDNTLCLYFKDSSFEQLDTLENYIKGILKSSFKIINELNIKYAEERGATVISILTNIFVSSDFNLNNSQKEDLFNSGYNSVNNLFCDNK